MISFLSRAGLLGLATGILLMSQVAAQENDLGSVLQSNKNLSTYYNLIKVSLEIGSSAQRNSVTNTK